MSRAVTRFSGRLAVAVAALAALAVGVGVGSPVAAVGVAGALAFGWGAGALDTDRNRRRALGSVATVAGGLAVLGGAAAAGADPAGFVATSLALLGVTAVAVDATAGLGDETLAPVLASLGSSIATVIAGVAAASLLHVAFGVALLPMAVFAVAGLSLSTPLGAFVALQLQALAVGFLMVQARATVESWFPDGVPVEAWEEFDALTLTRAEVPRAYWVALAVQVVALVAGANAVVELLLASTWLFGAAVAWVLQSGVLHAALGAVLALEAAVLAGEFLRASAVTAMSPNPPKSLSYAAGGIVFAVGVPLAVAAVALVGWVTGSGDGLLLFGGTWGSAAAVLSLAVVALGVVFALEVTAVFAAERSLLPDRTAGFALGAAMLFGAAVLSAPAGAPALVTLAGVAAALVAWDLGETGVDVGSHLGTAADTRRAEIVHATGSVAVGVAGVTLAALSMHLLGPISVPGSGGRAVVALALSLVALLAFSAALDRPDPR
jgi:hypothetical protein